MLVDSRLLEPNGAAPPGRAPTAAPLPGADLAFAELALAFLRDNLPSTGRILDLTPDGGVLSRRLRDYGFPRVEAIHWRPETASLRGVPVHFLDLQHGWAKHLPGWFDALVALDVIDHLENPWHFARQCALAVRPGGFVILSLPNLASCQSRLEFLLWGEVRFFSRGTARPDHVGHLTAGQVEAIAERAGLEFVACHTGRRHGGPSGVSSGWLRNVLRLLCYPFMHGHRDGDDSLFVFQRAG